MGKEVESANATNSILLLVDDFPVLPDRRRTMTNDCCKVLFKPQNDYPADKLVDHRMEQYKLYLEMADRISARRQTANSYFLTLNTVLLSLVSYLSLGTEQKKWYWLVAIAGIVLSYMWYRLIRSYRDLNSAKFKVIHEIEAMLPMAPYDAEWEAVGRGKAPELYLPFTHVEIYVPWVFLILHVAVVLQCITWDNVSAFLTKT